MLQIFSYFIFVILLCYIIFCVSHIPYIPLKPVDLQGFLPSQHLQSITFWGFSPGSVIVIPIISETPTFDGRELTTFTVS